jgi:hypothetical protein
MVFEMPIWHHFGITGSIGYSKKVWFQFGFLKQSKASFDVSYPKSQLNQENIIPPIYPNLDFASK